jgi:hypothetical protein
MANLVKYTSTLDTRPLANLTRGWRAIDGAAVRFGAMAPGGGPAPEHTGHDGKPKGVTTNDVLKFIEYGVRGMPERPIIRYVQAARRQEIREASRDIARAVAQKRSHVPKLHALGAMLRDATIARIRAVDAVDTGQTVGSIHYVLERRGRG